jgi:hypothetical protein
MNLNKRNKHILFGVLIFLLCAFGFYYMPSIVSSKIVYNSQNIEEKKVDINKVEKEKIIEQVEAPALVPVTHINTPENVKAVYVSSWVAGSPNFRDSIIKMIDERELNAIVIDIKDSTGRISFPVSNEAIMKLGAYEKRIPDIRWLTNVLHKKGIYVIGRISVFQDPYLVKVKPEWAINKKSDGTVWKDKKGLSFLDPAKKEVHKYILDLALASYEEGFDEINFDYIRYPSDGNISDINYRLAEGEKKADKIENFFKFISTEIKTDNNIPISADLFGLTTEGVDDMGIGQVWEKTTPYFDFVSPMVYPSHYPSGYAGYSDPNKYPYEVITRSISSAINRTKAMGEDINKIRPWLQDFDMGTTYDKEKVGAQIRALNDLGLYSWMFWDPANKYTGDAFKLENNQ